MSLFGKHAAVLILAALASFGAMSAQAADKKSSKPPAAQNISMLNGKFSFTLPKGFTASTLGGRRRGQWHRRRQRHPVLQRHDQDRGDRCA